MRWESRPFLQADKNLHADAFEDYIQGLVAADPKEGSDHLREAVKIDPDFCCRVASSGAGVLRQSGLRSGRGDAGTFAEKRSERAGGGFLSRDWPSSTRGIIARRRTRSRS